MQKKEKKAKKKNSNTLLTIIVVLSLLGGVTLLAFPTFANYYNTLHATRAIASYEEEVSTLDPKAVDKAWKAAIKYNKKLVKNPDRYHLSEEEEQEYESLLNISGNGIMGYIEIPAIECALPIGHGTEEGVIAVAVGHTPGSSLPVGGDSAHCILCSHTGLPSARLFTDLNKLKNGDIFMIKVLDRLLTYEVDQILTVLPDEIDALEIEKGQDYCTLVTCTPYGINTHRLLVRGHRIPNMENVEHYQDIEKHIWMKIVAIVMPVLLFILFLLWRKRRRRKKQMKSDVDVQ